MSKFRHVFKDSAQSVVAKLKSDFSSRQPLSECHWNPNKDLLLTKINQEPSVRLLKIVKAAKLRSTGLPESKGNYITGITDRLHKLYPLLTNPNSLVTSIDVGVKNMAWIRGDIVTGHISKAECCSLITTDNPLQKNNAADYANATHAFIQTLPHDSVYLCEQQHLQRHNVKCLIVESQIHAFLYPRVVPLSSISVSRTMGITAGVSGLEGLTGTTSTYARKKKLVTYVVLEIAENHNDLLAFDEKVLSELDNSKKRDDVCDAIFQFLAFRMWSQVLNQWTNGMM